MEDRTELIVIVELNGYTEITMPDGTKYDYDDLTSFSKLCVEMVKDWEES
jgi:hypothetical protein